MASAIVTESTLAFLGVSANKTSWGTMLRGSYDWGAATSGAWWYILVPGLCIVVGGDGVHAVRPGAGDGAQPATAEGGVMSLLELDDVSVTYRVAVRRRARRARGVAVLDAGEALGVAGESGSGKSTLAMALLRLLPRDARVTGRILLDGEDVLAMKWGRLRAVRWAAASIVFQGAQHGLNPVQRIGEQIAEPLLVHGMATPAEARRQGRRAAGAGRAAGLAGPQLPARAVRRPAAASDDRDGAGLLAAADHRRRADDRAGRDGAGTGARR